MAEKKFQKVRIQHKHDTETNWSKAEDFKPLNGELILYEPDSTYDYFRFKVGDGVTNVKALPFIDAHTAARIAELQASLDNKVDKVPGKSLSTNDLTPTLKSNYDAAYEHSTNAHAPASAEKNVIVGIQKNGTDLTPDSSTRKVNITVPTKVSQLTNDSSFATTSTVTTAISELQGDTDKTVADAITDTATAQSRADSAYTLASTKVDKVDGKGLSTNDYTTTEKNKLAGIAEGANKTIVDTSMSSTSTNPVQNKVINEAIALKADTSTLKAHTDNKSNPHGVTKSQIGLGNVTNDAQVKRTEMGVASGVATLDSNGKVPTSQLPSYVDDVLEYTAKANFPTTGEDGKIYVDEATNKTYRWSGSAYVEISASLALGTTSSTAYAGDKGTQNASDIAALKTRATNIESKNTSQDTAISNAQSRADSAYDLAGTKVDKVDGKGLSTNDLTNTLKSNYDAAYDHSKASHARTDATKVEASSTNGKIKINGTETTVYTHPTGTNPHGTTKSDVGLGNVGNFKAVSTVASQGLTSTEQSNARANIGASATHSHPYDASGSAASALTSAKAYTDEEIATLTATVNGKSDSDHTHDGRYYTETEIDDKVTTLNNTIAGKANTSHTHTVSHTPAGSVGDKSITPAGSVSSTFTGTAHNHTFTGSTVTSGTANAGTNNANLTSIYSITGVGTLPTRSSVSMPNVNHTHAVTASGTVTSAFEGSSTISGTPSKTTKVYSITGVGTAASHSYTAPSLTASIADGCMTLSFSAGSHSFTANTVPTRSEVTLAASDHAHSVTATGAVTSTFTGSSVNSGVVDSTNRTSIYQITGVGTLPTKSDAISIPNSNHTHNVTASGSVGDKTATGTVKSTFTGTAASHNHGFTGTAATLTTSGN